MSGCRVKLAYSTTESKQETKQKQMRSCRKGKIFFLERYQKNADY